MAPRWATVAVRMAIFMANDLLSLTAELGGPSSRKPPRYYQKSPRRSGSRGPGPRITGRLPSRLLLTIREQPQVPPLLRPVRPMAFATELIISDQPQSVRRSVRLCDENRACST